MFSGKYFSENGKHFIVKGVPIGASRFKFNIIFEQPRLYTSRVIQKAIQLITDRFFLQKIVLQLYQSSTIIRIFMFNI